MAVNMKGKSLIEINPLSLEEIYQIFDLSRTLKEKQNTGEPHKLLEGKTLGRVERAAAVVRPRRRRAEAKRQQTDCFLDRGNITHGTP